MRICYPCTGDSKVASSRLYKPWLGRTTTDTAFYTLVFSKYLHIHDFRTVSSPAGPPRSTLGAITCVVIIFNMDRAMILQNFKIWQPQGMGGGQLWFSRQPNASSVDFSGLIIISIWISYSSKCQKKLSHSSGTWQDTPLFDVEKTHSLQRQQWLL